MARESSPQFSTMRVRENCTDGRDFVVGDVHGEFPTLESLLAQVGFAPERDRLFALGDLVDRGPRSTDALAWMETQEGEPTTTPNRISDGPNVRQDRARGAEMRHR